LTTGITDAVLAIISVTMMFMLLRTQTTQQWKQRLWAYLFGLAGLASLLGFVVHGFEWDPMLSTALWHPLYLSLGLVVALFVVGGLYDLRGAAAARSALPWALGGGVTIYALIQMMGGNFLLFVVYEAAAMLTALTIYLHLTAVRRVGWAATVAAGIVLNLVAAAIQASDITVFIVWRFDHNGVFHLVQMVAIVVLAFGVRAGLRETAS